MPTSAAGQAVGLPPSSPSRKRRRIAGLLALALASLALVVTGVEAGSAVAASGPPSPGPASALITPSVNITDQQVVDVEWSGLKPTAPDPQAFFPRDEVGIYECTASTPDGNWYYSRDCYTEPPPNNVPIPSVGNMVDPTQVNHAHGVTVANGTGERGFQILAGTLHTNAHLGQPAFDVQCDATHPCVLKVVDFATFFRKFTIPNAYRGGFNPVGTGDWTDLVDHAVSIPIDFETAAVCPPPAASTAQLSLEGAPSSSYDISEWGTALCTARPPVQVNYVQLGESLARSDFASGSTELAIAAASPKTGPDGGGYIAAPIDVSGVAITFNMIDAVTGAPITRLRLTPRLVAMLVTDSAIHGAADYPAAEYYPLTSDPEFQALNPGFNFPDDPNDPTSLGVIEPILEGYQGDDTEILTQWIADDADARAFLAGHDVCGAELNPNWAGVQYPTDILEDLERNSTTPFLPLAGYYNPITNLATEVADVFYGKAAGYLPPSLGAPVNMPVVDTQEDALFGIFDATSAARSGEPTASLSPASSTSTIGNYVDVDVATHTCTPKTLSQFPGFSSPDGGGLALGVGAMAINEDGTLASPVTTTVPGAYPLTKVDYAFLPSKGLSVETAQAAAQFVDYVSGAGQSPTVLPFGYTPLPTYLRSEDAAAAASVLKDVPPPVAKKPTTTTTVTTTTLPTTRSTSTSTTVAPLVASGTSPSSTTQAASPTTAADISAGGSSHTTPVGSSNQPPSAAGSAPTPQAIQAPVSISAAVRTGTWIIPLVAILALVLGVIGAALVWPGSTSWLPWRKGAPPS